VGTRVALANQLRAELERYWPGAAVIFKDIDSPISLAFIKRYPSPGEASGLGVQRLGWFLARHAYSGGKQPAQLIRKLRPRSVGTGQPRALAICSGGTTAIVG
ncbi:MAG: IS110 family transposase, partial [Solirubrobacteraceae bacterium]